MSLYKITRLLVSTCQFKQYNIFKFTYYSTSDTCGSSFNSDNSGEEQGSKQNAPTFYDCRKYGHNLPSNKVTPEFDTLPDIPTGIFRCTTGEVLGSGVADGTCYQNPEYFSFHHMTYYDMHMALRPYRNPSPKTGRKK
ncbi:unnamed protein product [Parnassius mnemosyne]|uniref:NADH dehydrogenase [ubiquinone] flavoprotein 3, mitochondrial n=1 Tax=Parnassius mnemosyne TaxID=213953 RepID=A0AAV1M6I0_9NEOP